MRFARAQFAGKAVDPSAEPSNNGLLFGSQRKRLNSFVCNKMSLIVRSVSAAELGDPGKLESAAKSAKCFIFFLLWEFFF
jgi:hypothetical protein